MSIKLEISQREGSITCINPSSMSREINISLIYTGWEWRRVVIYFIFYAISSTLVIYFGFILYDFERIFTLKG